MVSRWTLCHLVDPFGTVTKMYGLLNPSKGKLLAQGFSFMHEDSLELQEFPPLDNQHVVCPGNASALFYAGRALEFVDHFMLERNDDKPLTMPLEYTGRYQNYNQIKQVTEFRHIIAKGSKQTRDHINPKEKLYCLSGDEKCQKLYAFLKESGLVERGR
jgi:hypothetical protein